MSDNENSGGGAPADVKPTVTYELTILDNAGTYPLSVKVKPNTPIVKVLKVWCEHHAQVLNTWAFMLDGQRINLIDDDGQLVKTTIKQLEIDEDCQIDAVIHQLGGSR